MKEIKKTVAFFAILAVFSTVYGQSGIMLGNKLAGNQGYIKNKGQIITQNNRPNAAVKYLLCSPDFNIQLRQTGFSYDTYTQKKDTSYHKPNLPSHQFNHTFPDHYITYYHRVDVELLGCNTHATIIPTDSSVAYFNYFTTGTPAGGVKNVHYYQKVLYKNIYPHIDMEFYTSGREYNFIIHSGGNISDIKLQYKGANKVILENGALNVQVNAGHFTESIPKSYIAATGQPVAVKYRAIPSPNEEGKDGATYGFSIQHSKLNIQNSTFVIDPTPCLDWGTYYGEGGNENLEQGIARDKNNDIYISGSTGDVTNIATAGAYQTVFGGTAPYGDALIAKFNSTGSSLLWGTYYGGSGDECAYSIAVDTSDNVFICGYSESTGGGLSTPGAYKTAWAPMFVAKFSSSGSSLLWGTYYGGAGVPNAITVDAYDNVYITGGSYYANDVATSGAYKTVIVGGGATYGAFVAKFNSSGSNLIWGTWYGGNYGLTEMWGIALDAQNNVYVSGHTNCTSAIATLGAYQTTYGGGSGDGDAVIAKFNSTGTKLLWGTYYGGVGNENGNDLAIDANKNIYVVGYTDSSFTGIATPWAYQTTYGGGFSDGFVAKFDSTCSHLIWGTYYGGAGMDDLQSIALDKNNDVYVGGGTSIYPYPGGDTSLNMATTNVYQPIFKGIDDGILAKFNSAGNILWGTYLGTYAIGVSAVAMDTASGDIYVAGSGSDNSLYTPGAYKKYNSVTANQFFVAKFGCNIPNGVNAIKADSGGMKVYPNPSGGLITIELKNPTELKTAFNIIHIYNMLGEQVKSEAIKSMNTVVDLSANPSGIYLYRIVTSTGNLIGQGKFVIEK